MAFIKPTVTKVREYDTPSQNNGMIVNPPRFEKVFGGLTNKNKTGPKNKMAVTDRGNGKHGPFGKHGY